MTPAPTLRTGPASGGALPRLADWRVRWLAPALGVAAALAVLLVLRPPWRGAQQVAPETLVAQAPKQELPLPSEPAEADRLSRLAPSQPEAPLAAPRREGPPPSEGAPPNSRVGAAAKTGEEVGAARDKALPFQADEKFKALQNNIEAQAPSSSASSSNSPGPQAAASEPVAPPPPAKPAPNMAASEAAQLDAGANSVGSSASREKQAVAASGAPAPNAAAGSAIPQRKVQDFALVRPQQKDSSVLKAPSSSTLWRFGLRGTIERSTDAGRTWASQASPSPEDWLAGAAVSDAICWLVGRHGAIARTVDGEHWEGVAPPLQTAGSNAAMPDWVGVAAADAQTVTIAANDGRKFATTDGGKTWQQQSQK